MEQKETIQIKIYRDTKLDIMATYKPVVCGKMSAMFEWYRNKCLERI